MKQSIIAIVFLLVELGCGKKDDAKPGASSQTGGSPTMRASQAKVDEPVKTPETTSDNTFTLVAKDFFAECKADPEKATKKYAGKVVEVTGVVVRVVGAPLSPNPIIMLNSGEELSPVQCMTNDKQPFLKVSPGQTVKVRGKCTENSAREGAVMNCVIVETGPNPAVMASAPELAKQFKADKDGAEKKYDRKYVIVVPFAEMFAQKRDLIGSHIRLSDPHA